VINVMIVIIAAATRWRTSADQVGACSKYKVRLLGKYRLRLLGQVAALIHYSS
jgi:hypothetical protein